MTDRRSQASRHHRKLPTIPPTRRQQAFWPTFRGAVTWMQKHKDALDTAFNLMEIYPRLIQHKTCDRMWEFISKVSFYNNLENEHKSKLTAPISHPKKDQIIKESKKTIPEISVSYAFNNDMNYGEKTQSIRNVYICGNTYDDYWHKLIINMSEKYSVKCSPEKSERGEDENEDYRWVFATDALIFLFGEKSVTEDYYLDKLKTALKWGLKVIYIRDPEFNLSGLLPVSEIAKCDDHGQAQIGSPKTSTLNDLKHSISFTTIDPPSNDSEYPISQNTSQFGKIYGIKTPATDANSSSIGLHIPTPLHNGSHSIKPSNLTLSQSSLTSPNSAAISGSRTATFLNDGLSHVSSNSLQTSAFSNDTQPLTSIPGNRTPTPQNPTFDFDTKADGTVNRYDLEHSERSNLLTSECNTPTNFTDVYNTGLSHEHEIYRPNIGISKSIEDRRSNQSHHNIYEYLNENTMHLRKKAENLSAQSFHSLGVPDLNTPSKRLLPNIGNSYDRPFSHLSDRSYTSSAEDLSSESHKPVKQNLNSEGRSPIPSRSNINMTEIIKRSYDTAFVYSKPNHRNAFSEIIMSLADFESEEIKQNEQSFLHAHHSSEKKNSMVNRESPKPTMKTETSQPIDITNTEVSCDKFSERVRANSLSRIKGHRIERRLSVQNFIEGRFSPTETIYLVFGDDPDSPKLVHWPKETSIGMEPISNSTSIDSFGFQDVDLSKSLNDFNLFYDEDSM